ncbi:MAG: ABC transporter ATP-binding protein/permease [Oscillospiraceae bacterium]|nr:ABC transporter ATP-binding protein/permease [Oscillospiraceae bacterium]
MNENKTNLPKASPKLLGRLIGYMFRHYAAAFVAVIVCIVISVSATLRSVLFMQTLVDDYITPMVASYQQTATTPDFAPLALALVRLGIFLLIGVLATYGYTRIMVNVTQGTMRNMRVDLFTKMESLPIRFFDTTAHGDIMSAYTNDIDTFRQFLSQSLPQLINAVITLVVTVVSMFVLNVPLAVISVVMGLIVVLVIRNLSDKSGIYYTKQQQDLGAANGFIEEYLDGQKVVKVFCHEDAAEEDFRKLNQALRASADTANNYANRMMPVSINICNLNYVICAIVGGLLFINGFPGISLGVVVAFLGLSRSFIQPFAQVSQQMNFVVMASAGAVRIFHLLDQEPETDEGFVDIVNAKYIDEDTVVESDEQMGTYAWKFPDENGGFLYQKLEGYISFDCVDFGYTDEKMVLHNISMYAKPGEKIALVGSTGAGKTTITNLINRFYDIQNGSIYYDGLNIQKIKKSSLRRTLGIVLQDTHLFTGTIMENIRYGNLDASDDECIAAAKLANAHDFIERLPEGYETFLTGDGGNLSQGQRQLLSIARAAVADPPALILDEATSSIDTRTEKLVQSGMDSLMYGRSSFVIAHRLSTVKNSDCIMVMELGEVIERGTHDELMDRKGKYYQLYTGNFAEEIG